jgi:hypothetical protein
MTLDHALTLIDRAGTSTRKKTERLKKRAKRVLQHAKHIAKRASRGKRAKLTPECGATIEDAAGSVSTEL